LFIFTDFNAESRLLGPPHDSNLTFHIKKGSCRDLSWMQIQLLRFMGIAARFVSGYYFLPTQNTPPELHGWLEVYLPGAGWVGFDPSHGCIAGSSHIPVCASSQYQNTMPVTGSFEGSGTSTLSTNLNIETFQGALV
jgi:transglutaminase-like putative cysteine protease